MGNTVQHKRRNPANCLGCMGQDNEGFDQNELQIGLDGDKARGRITQQSTAYLTENERNFFKAASGRNLGLIRFYLNNGININLLDEDRTSPLHIACRYGSIQVVEELINNYANLDITDMAGWTPLHVAAFYQRAQVCQQLLKSGADPKIRNRDGNLAQDLVRDKMTSEIFKQLQDFHLVISERQIKKIDPAQRQFEEYFQHLKQKRQKNHECSSYCDKQSKIVSPLSTPSKLKQQGEKENLMHQESLSKSGLSEVYEQKEMYDYREGSKINRNLASPSNSIPRFFDDIICLNQLVLWQNATKERVTFTDQIKFIKHDTITERFALELFNYSSQMGISYMIATRMISPNSQSIVNWIFQDIESKNKRQLAKLLTNLNLQEQPQILKLYIDKGINQLNLIDSLHDLFSQLSVQNDPYLIDILVKEFSRRHYELHKTNKNPSFPFKSEESLHMFCFALVILDIEINKYDKENAFRSFFQNIQTINNGDNLNSQYVHEIIEQLQAKSIVALAETQIEEGLINKLNRFCTPISLVKQKSTSNVTWKLYRISDLCLLISDGIIKIFQKSNSILQKSNNELSISGKNEQLTYLICKDEQTFIFKQRNKKFILANPNDTI